MPLQFVLFNFCEIYHITVISSPMEDHDSQYVLPVVKGAANLSLNRNSVGACACVSLQHMYIKLECLNHRTFVIHL